jgi:hypothetical protein
MLKYSLIGTALVLITVIIHAAGTTSWLRVVGRRYPDTDDVFHPNNAFKILIGTVLILLALHTLEIIVWASAYLLLLPPGELGSFEEAAYFSFVTFTTLGYGDITLSQDWRLLSGIEALNGIMLVGWTTAMLFAVVQRTWQGIAKQKSQGESHD